MVHKKKVKKPLVKKVKFEGTEAYLIGNKLYIVPKFWKRKTFY